MLQFLRRSQRYFCIVGMFLICAAHAAHAVGDLHANPNPQRWLQLADTTFQHFGKDKGMQYATTALVEDADGFLWLGTQGGLARWDGYRFRFYRPNPNDPHALPDNYILNLHTDQQGRLWVGTSNGGIARYEPESDHFTVFRPSSNQVEHTQIHALADDGNGGVWVGTEGGLDHVSRFRPNIEHTELVQHGVLSLLRDRQANLWLGSTHGLLKMARGERQVKPVALALPNEVAIISLLETQDGRLWLGTRKHGAFVYDVQRNTLQAVQESFAPDSLLATEQITAMVEVRPGVVWLATFGHGIVVFDTRSGQSKRLKHDPSLPTNLANNIVWTILRDRAGLIWVGTAHGLSMHDPAQDAIATILGAAQRQHGISGTDVFSIMPMPDERFWIGLGTNGLDILQADQMRVASLRSDVKMPRSALPKDDVFSMIAVPDGQVFLATGRGVYVTDVQARSVRRVEWPGRDPLARTDTLSYHRGVLWLGGRDDGLWRCDLRLPQKIERIGHSQAGLGFALSDQRVNVIHPGLGQQMWIGTRNGLNLLDSENLQIQQIKSNPGQPQALAGAYITSLITDQEGRLWIGHGAGINILRPQAGKQWRFQHLNSTHGLPDNNVGKFLQDKQGVIWVSTDDGLAKIDPHSLQIQALRRADGLLISNYWVNSGAMSAHNEVMFGGQGGLTIVRPERLQEWRYQPPVVLTDLRVGGKSLATGPYQKNRAKPELVIQPEDNKFAIEFAALDYSAPERNRYAYQLEGFDQDWIESDSSRRLASYNNLPPGKYHLRLRGSNRNGVWSPADFSMVIRVLPSWYQTISFRLLALCLGLIALTAFVRGKTRYLEMRQLELESEVAQRTANLHEQKLQLQQANQGLRLSADTLRQLGEVGRDITANLDAEAVFSALDRHVNALLQVNAFVIFRISADATTLEQAFGRENGQTLQPIALALTTKDSAAVRAVHDRREILLNYQSDFCSDNVVDDEHEAIHSTIRAGTRSMNTALYAPLIVDQQSLGVMTIQSEIAYAFGEREQLIFRTLCAYGAIALANAESLAALRRAQSQLVQAEKMVALGQLVAGVAHEINTPIGAVKASGKNIAHSLQHALQNLPQLLHLLEPENAQLFIHLIAQIESNQQVLNTREERALMRDLSAQLELEGILDARHKASILVQLQAHTNWQRFLPLLRHAECERILDTAYNFGAITSNTANINTAVERVSKIVFALRAFSRVEQTGQMQLCDLREGIETVLMIYRGQLRLHIELVRDYEEIAPIMCLPDELNQVWTNLIHNALQAMQYKGRLSIAISRQENQAVVSIADTGCGIPLADRERIFDAFFTTKQVGEGTGLGLDIVKKIIAKHQGRVVLESEVGVGSKFIVYLPYQ